MLLVHGFPEFWYCWRHQITEFSKDFWFVAIFTLFHGRNRIWTFVTELHFLQYLGQLPWIRAGTISRKGQTGNKTTKSKILLKIRALIVHLSKYDRRSLTDFILRLAKAVRMSKSVPHYWIWTQRKIFCSIWPFEELLMEQIFFYRRSIFKPLSWWVASLFRVAYEWWLIIDEWRSYFDLMFLPKRNTAANSLLLLRIYSCVAAMSPIWQFMSYNKVAAEAESLLVDS